MKYLTTHWMDKEEKEEVKKKGLFCYDLRSGDNGEIIATIERNVWVNRVGSIITNEEIPFKEDNFIDYESFERINENVWTIEDITKQNKEETRKNKKSDRGAR